MTISSNDITLQDPTNNIEIELENKKQGSITGVNVGKEQDGSDGGSVSNVIGSGGGNMRSGKPFMGHKQNSNSLGLVHENNEGVKDTIFKDDVPKQVEIHITNGYKNSQGARASEVSK